MHANLFQLRTVCEKFAQNVAVGQRVNKKLLCSLSEVRSWMCLRIFILEGVAVESSWVRQWKVEKDKRKDCVTGKRYKYLAVIKRTSKIETHKMIDAQSAPGFAWLLSSPRAEASALRVSLQCKYVWQCPRLLYVVNVAYVLEAVHVRQWVLY